MNKKVKYIGSAVAAALALAAPVIVTNFSPTTSIVQAAGEDEDIDYSPTEADAATYFRAYRAQFGDIYVSDVSALALPMAQIADEIDEDSQDYGDVVGSYSYFNGDYNDDHNATADGGQYIFDIQNDTGNSVIGGLRSLQKKYNKDINFKNASGAYIYRDVLGYLSIADPESIDNPGDNTTYLKGTESLSTQSDIYGDGGSYDYPDPDSFVGKLKDNQITFPITVTVHLTGRNFENSDYNKANETIIPGDVQEFSFEIKQSNFKVTTDNNKLSFGVGKAIDLNKTGSSNSALQVIDNYSDSENSKYSPDSIKGMETPIYGNAVYSSKKDALTAAKSGFDPANEKGNVTLKDGAIDTAGTYYQTISYKLKSDGDKAVNQMLSNVDNGSTGSKVDDYPVYIDESTTAATEGTDSDYVLDKSDGYLTIVREITINNTSPITETLKSLGAKVGDSTAMPVGDTSLKSGDTDVGYSTNINNTYYTNPQCTKEATDDQITDNKFLKSGKYYRKIDFVLTDGDASQYSSTTALSSSGKNITYAQEVDVSDPVKTKTAVTLNDTTAKVGQDTTGLDKDADAKLTTADGKTTIASGDQVSVGSDFFDSLDDAKANTKTANYTNGKFTKAGSYYQLVSFKLNQADIETYDFNSDPNYVKNDGNTVIFARKVTVSTPSSSGSNSSSNSNDENWTINYQSGTAKTKDDQDNYNITNDDNKVIDGTTIPKNTTLNIDRARIDQNGNVQYHIADGEWINANYVTFTAKSDGDDDWIYYKDPGYVVTFDKQDYYSLNNRENSIVTNRALAEKSAWVTDQYRTNKNGVKQYRVATNEWIDSHDVIFVKAMKRIVNVDQTKSYYSLYNIEEHLITNRALDHKTSWYTDATAEDADGNIYYRVASNEWVKQVDGVHVDSSAWY